MNRAKAEQITDRILARMEQDGDGRGPVAHKDSITDEIVAASDEIIDVIWRDDDGVWKHRDGTPFDMDADKNPDYLEHVRRQIGPDWSYPIGDADAGVGRVTILDVVTHNGCAQLVGPSPGALIMIDGELHQFTGSHWAPLPALDLDDRDTA